MSRLEEHLCKRLIDRAPSIRMTDAGDRLYTEIAPLFDGLLEAEKAIRSDDGKVRGRIRVVGPQEVVRWVINPAIVRILNEKHQVNFEVEATSRVPNPLEDPVDVYISHRREEVTNKSLIARRICAIPQGLFASPKLIGRRVLPKTPTDLAQWPCLGRLGEPEWELIDEKGRKHVVPVRGAVFSTPSETRVELALLGIGIAQINLHHGNEAVKMGDLVRILPGYTLHNMYLHAFLLSRRLIPQAVQIFMRYATEEARKYFPE